MQSFNLLVVFAAVLLINTQVNCGSFVCPIPGQPEDQKDAYCIRRITRKELRDPANKNATMFKLHITEKGEDGFTCDDVILNGKPARDSFCCNAPGDIGVVLPSPQSMWDNKCSIIED
ncbi:hypothetical protein PGT21_027003 [Puccinia graminis f. sp. tritici]|uniref:Hydrophobin n=1 Tax=Puccinia graminis f. sp. tritici TaxID=56615 RepID=A0A5B0NHE6_PUCGR|nr:hypothetical protein PGT21_027003 [Puccinia graminis f. sp. tritici]